MVQKKPTNKESRERVRRNSKANRVKKYEKLIAERPSHEHVKAWVRKRDLV